MTERRSVAELLMVALSDRKIEIVRTIVEAAPDKVVGGLRAALQEAVGDTVLASVRQLVETEVQDRTLRNAVFAPVAPLFVGEGRDPGALSFPSRAFALIWRGLKTHTPGEMEAAAHAADALAFAQAAARSQRLPDPSPAFNAVVNTAALALREREPREFAMAAELCDAARPGGAESLAACLDISPIVRRALPRLHDWITQTGDEVGAPARLAYKDSVAISPDAGPLFFETLAAQLDPPWMVLRIISAVMDKPSERYLADSELSAFAERLLGQIDEELKAVSRMDLDGGADVGCATARRVELITQQVFELEVSIELSRDHGWGHRLLEQKKSLANLVEAKLKDSEKLVEAALPMQTTGFGRARRSGPKLDAPPELRAVGRATTMLHFVHEARHCANYGGFSAMHAKITEKLGAAIDTYVEDVVADVRNGDAPDPAVAYEHLRIAARLIGLVRDEKAAELVRRRAAAACSPQEPAGGAVILDA